MTTTESTWTPSSWHGLPAGQQPEWPDQAALAAVRERLSGLPPLVFAGEARALLAALGEVCEGRAFLLQAGDCVESFRDVSAPAIREKLEGAAADVGRPHVRRDAPGRQGRSYRRPVRKAAHRAHRGRRRSRAPLFPGPRRPFGRADRRRRGSRTPSASSRATTRPPPR